MKAIWNGAVIAESDEGVVVEGNYYFPLESVNKDLLEQSQTHTTCPWKGVASYYDVVVDGKANHDAAWYYPRPSAAAAGIIDHVAFWKGVRVSPAEAPARGGSQTGGIRELVGRFLGR